MRLLCVSASTVIDAEGKERLPADFASSYFKKQAPRAKPILDMTKWLDFSHEYSEVHHPADTHKTGAAFRWYWKDLFRASYSVSCLSHLCSYLLADNGSDVGFMFCPLLRRTLPWPRGSS